MYPPHNSNQFTGNLMKIELISPPLGDDGIVSGSKKRFMQSVKLPHISFQAVTDNGITHLPAYGNADFNRATANFFFNYQKIPAVALQATAGYIKKITPLQQSFVLWKSKRQVASTLQRW